jgi:hypothetical protein
LCTVQQITQLSDTWLEALRGPDGQYDWAKYRTNMGISFQEIPGNVEWCARGAAAAELCFGRVLVYTATGSR